MLLLSTTPRRPGIGRQCGTTVTVATGWWSIQSYPVYWTNCPAPWTVRLPGRALCSGQIPAEPLSVADRVMGYPARGGKWGDKAPVPSNGTRIRRGSASHLSHAQVEDQVCHRLHPAAGHAGGAERAVGDDAHGVLPLGSCCPVQHRAPKGPRDSAVGHPELQSYGHRERQHSPADQLEEHGTRDRAVAVILSSWPMRHIMTIASDALVVISRLTRTLLVHFSAPLRMWMTFTGAGVVSTMSDIFVPPS